MRDSDWSRRNLLRSDWSGPRVAIYTTNEDGKICVTSVTLSLYRREK